MSRKEPSFGQLAAYLRGGDSERAFDLRHNLFASGAEDIVAEFKENATLLKRRRNGNFLYHEILSIDTRRCGQSRDTKQALRELALAFIERRCAGCLVYGSMHQDHGDHLHYHLMISANERGEAIRYRLPKAEFDRAKRETEALARDRYPQLQQVELIGSSTQEKQARRQERDSQKVREMKRRGAAPTKRDELANELRAMMSYAASLDELRQLLKDQGFELYERGKHFGIRPLEQGNDGKKRKAHRFATLGIENEFADFRDRIDPPREAPEVEMGGSASEKEKTEAERGQAAREPESDNKAYVKYDSNTDPKEPLISAQNPGRDQEDIRAQEAEDLSERQQQWKREAEKRQTQRLARERDRSRSRDDD